MTQQTTSRNVSWSNHETGAAQLARVGTALRAPQRDSRAAAWLRTGLIVGGMVASVAALKLFALP